jgi:CheY-like chemotaxis protein
MLIEQNSNYYPTFNPVLFPFGMSMNRTKAQKRVLIVDDDREIVDLLRTMLQTDENVKIFTAQDPYEAMATMTNQVFDMIILDWNLPNLNGLQTLIETEREFKSDPNIPLEWDNKKVRVIVFSGNERSECKTSNTKHFRYSGYVHKGKNIESIVSDFKEYIQKTV